MRRWEYDVVMQTPLGPRNGRLLLETEDGIVAGTLHILGGAEPLHGKIDAFGCCKLSGRLTTPFQTIDFTAAGFANERKVELTLQGERHGRYRIHGVVAAPAKGE